MKATAWLLLYRPTDLSLALTVTEHLQAEGFSCGLIYGQHDYWKYVRLDPYAEKYIRFHRIANLLKADDFKTAWRLRKRVRAEKAKLEALNIGPDDLIVVFHAAAYLFLNVFLSHCRRNPRILMISRDMYGVARRKESAPGGHCLTWNKLLEWACSLYPTRLVVFNSHMGKFSEWGLFFLRPLHQLFDAIVLTSINPQKTFEIEKDFSPNVRLTFNPLICRAKDLKRGKVVFFSGGMSLYVKTEHRGNMVRILNLILDYLRRHFSGHELVYRPHPFYEGEVALLNLAGFQVELDGEISEIYLQKNQDQIYAVFSDISSSSLAAFAYGLRAASFAKILPISPSELSAFCSQFPDIPEEHYLNSLENAPDFHRQTAPDMDRRNQFTKDLSHIISSVRAARKQLLPSPNHPKSMQTPSPVTDPSAQILALQQTILNLRHEVERLQEHLVDLRMKDLELQRKEQVIQELKTAAEERLALINQLTGVHP